MSTEIDPILTSREVAQELRISRSHLYHIFNGDIHGVKPIPHLKLGTKRVVMRSVFEQWKRENQSCESVQKN